MTDGPVQIKIKQKYRGGPASPRDKRDFWRKHPKSGGQQTSARTSNVVSKQDKPVSEEVLLPWQTCGKAPGSKSCGKAQRKHDKTCNGCRYNHGG